MQTRLVPVLACAVLAACGKRAERPLSPQLALQSFRLSEDFRVELVAAEPDVVDPVEVVFDENGRIYVAEMLDYPDDPPPGKPARSRVRLLEDADEDGRFERNVIFADHVLQVSGILPWQGGLIVTSAPDILFMKDTDGDGRADVRKVLYTGFPKVNPEARITNPRYGIDNWIYCANEGRDGRITSPDHPERPPVMVRGADFRFHPIRGLAEPASGPTQYGMTFDDWGNRFLTQNTIHIRHAVLPMQYLARAPLLEVGAVSQDISDHGSPSVRVFPLTKPQAWREQRTRLRQQRYDETHQHRTEHVGGYFTAATGGTVYTGDAWPREYVGNVFTGDVNGNLVHRDLLTPAGVTFTARRAKDGVEFLASTDGWFRPCNFANAPDGNLYMADIYREFVETPESIPDAIKSGMNFWSGDTMGRIYRIAPSTPRVKRGLRVNLGRMSAQELVGLLEHSNGWHRMTAQRLLVERQDRAVAPALRELAAKSPSPLARLHALWTLEGLGVLETAEVAPALKDPHPGIREHALRLAEPFLPRMAEAVLALASDPEPRVQFQLAFTLGYVKQPRAAQVLAEIAARHGADKWFRAAILSSVSDQPAQFLDLLLRRKALDLVPQLAALIGTRRQPAEIVQVINAASTLPKPEEALAGLARGLKLASASDLKAPGVEAALERLLGSPSEAVESPAWEVASHFELRSLAARATRDALDVQLAPARRAQAIRALRGAAWTQTSTTLGRVLSAEAPAAVHIAAVETLAAFNHPQVSMTLLSFWKKYQPEARAKAVAALLGAQARVPALLKALEERQIEASALDIAARARLIEMGGRAKELVEAQAGDRNKVVDAYRDVVRMAGDVERGKRLFEENCARCHLPLKQGGRVGPDLSGINNKTKEELLTSILHPSYAIEPRYTNYIVTTKDGRLYDGVIAHETPAAITLRGGSEEGDQTVLRANIAEIRSSSISLMPDELDKTLSRQGLADVIAYLRGGI